MAFCWKPFHGLFPVDLFCLGIELVFLGRIFCCQKTGMLRLIHWHTGFLCVWAPCFTRPGCYENAKWNWNVAEEDYFLPTKYMRDVLCLQLCVPTQKNNSKDDPTKTCCGLIVPAQKHVTLLNLSFAPLTLTFLMSFRKHFCNHIQTCTSID